MTLKARSTTWLTFSRFVCVSICLCLFAVLPAPQLAVLTYAAPAEAEPPRHEGSESSKEELVVRPAARRNVNRRCGSHLSRSYDTCGLLRQVASYAGHFLAIVGHQLPNGFRAPLLI